MAVPPLSLHARLVAILALRLLSACLAQQATVGHILPHSHCDAAYKKTVNEYYETEVGNVLNSVVDALPNDKRRRFVWAETVFLEKWWKDVRTTQQQRSTFRSLVENNQIELVCGGWVMHDEAITRYDTQIHQMTHGHSRMMKLVRKAPRTGYQIDPFGASSFSVLLHKWAGMKMILHNRVVGKDALKKNQSLEFTWKVQDEELWMHVYDDHYETRGFDWESIEVPSTPVTTANVQERTDAYMSILRNKTAYYKTPHVLIPFGGDFRFQNASLQFRNMDMIVNYANAHPERYQGATLQYTTVQEYQRVIQQEYNASDFPVVEGSPFLPLWTGYYYGLPVLKQMVRACEMVLRIVETCAVQSDANILLQLDSVRETVFLMQHHDAITGTSYRFVILDYMKRLKQCMDIMTNIISKLLLNNEEETLKLVGGGPYLHETVLVRGTEDGKSIHLDRVVDPQMGSDGIQLVLLNSLAWPVDTLVSFVCSRSDVGIVQGTSTQIQSQATPLEDELDAANLGLFLISFRASVPPLGQSRFVVKVCDLTWDTFQVPPAYLPSVQCANVASRIGSDEVFRNGISTDELHVQFDSQTNDISSVTVKDQMSWKLSHNVVLYDGSKDNLYTINAAIEDSDPTPLPKNAQIISGYNGPLFSQVTVQFNPWFRARYRVFNGMNVSSLLQVSVLSGVVPPFVNVASRFQTNLTASKEWFYDENGYIPVRATYNESEAIGANIRPMVSRAWLQRDSHRFTVFSGDPRGVVSRHLNSLDVFWHRRNAGKEWLMHGDDKSTVRSPVFFSFPSSKGNELAHRRMATELANDVALYASLYMRDRNEGQVLQTVALPDDVHLVSFRKSSENLSPSLQENTVSSREVWVDIQVENLSSERSQVVDLFPLLQSVPNVVTENATLSSLTFAHTNIGTTCRLDASMRDELKLAIGKRRICSVRVQVRSTAYNMV